MGEPWDTGWGKAAVADAELGKDLTYQVQSQQRAGWCQEGCEWASSGRSTCSPDQLTFFQSPYTTAATGAFIRPFLDQADQGN